MRDQNGEHEQNGEPAEIDVEADSGAGLGACGVAAETEQNIEIGRDREDDEVEEQPHPIFFAPRAPAELGIAPERHQHPLHDNLPPFVIPVRNRNSPLAQISRKSPVRPSPEAKRAAPSRAPASSGAAPACASARSASSSSPSQAAQAEADRKSTRLNSSHVALSRMQSSG